MQYERSVWLRLAMALVCAFAVSFAATPFAKKIAEKVGAIDVPKESRRVHDHPIPRMGGLAIFIGFIVSMLIFAQMSTPVMGMLVGAVIIVAMGAIDDVVSLNAWVKLAAQVIAAAFAIRCGVLIDVLSTPTMLSENYYIIGYLAYPVTLLWIVGCTNAVNLIDGLDGLAVGVSTISCLTMLAVAMMVSEPSIALILAALAGACLGFAPYNKNPAKIFMGDTGAQLLGYVLACASVMGMFKFSAIVTIIVPVFALAVPLADTAFAFFRRILRGESPFHADRGHFHHRLLDMGLSQKQAVTVLYAISAIMGLLAVLLSSHIEYIRIICIAVSFIIAVVIWLAVFRHNPNIHVPHHESGEEKDT